MGRQAHAGSAKAGDWDEHRVVAEDFRMANEPAASEAQLINFCSEIKAVPTRRLAIFAMALIISAFNRKT